MAHAFLDHVAAGRIDQAFEGFIDYRNGKGSWAAMPEKARERMRAGTASSVAGFRANLGNPTTVDDLRGIIAPTLMIRGGNTTAPDRRVAEIVHAAIPNCEYRIIPGAEHMSPTTHPELVAAAIVAHLNRL